MLQITEAISLRDDEIQLDFVQSPGPGGQNVNKVATAVQLRFDVLNSPSLPEDVRQRLVRLAGKRLTDQGVLMINAHRFRSRERNRLDALERLAALIRKAAEAPKVRRKTKPTLASQQERLETKRHRSVIKRSRQESRRIGAEAPE